MAFRQGKYTELTVSGVALSAYLDSVDFSRDVEMLETTTFTASAKTFLPGLSEAKMDIKGKYDPLSVTGVTGGPANLLTNLVGAGNTVPIKFYPGGNTSGQLTRSMDGYVASYKESAAVGDIVAFEASFQISNVITASGLGVF
jgi:hypothetical protein